MTLLFYFQKMFMQETSTTRILSFKFKLVTAFIYHYCNKFVNLSFFRIAEEMIAHSEQEMTDKI